LKLYSGAYGHFLVCFLNSQKPADGDRGNYWGYNVGQWVLANAPDQEVDQRGHGERLCKKIANT